MYRVSPGGSNIPVVAVLALNPTAFNSRPIASRTPDLPPLQTLFFSYLFYFHLGLTCN